MDPHTHAHTQFKQMILPSFVENINNIIMVAFQLGEPAVVHAGLFYLELRQH